jgi:hypothetical protein
MKKETKFRLSVLPIVICAVIYFAAYVKDNEFHTYGSTQVITIDTVLHTYYSVK